MCRESIGVVFKEEPMKRTRITLARLMTVVAVVAVDLAAFIVACRSDKGELALGLAPTGLACQIGVLCAVLSGGRSRTFWVGFVVFGCAMMMTFVWAGWFTESAANDAWVSYAELAPGVISTIPRAPQWLFDGGDVSMAAVLCLPQLVAACVGGVFATLVALVTRRFFGVRALDLGRDEGRASLPHSSEPLGSADAAR
jgi:hypothetical protein